MPNIILRHFSVSQKETAVSDGDGYTGAVHFAFDVENAEVFDMNQLVLDVHKAFRASIEQSSAPAKKDDDGEEEEKPRRSRRAKKDDDDEEEEKPRRSRRAKKDDDEEEEKPRRSRRAKKDDDDEEEEKPRRSRRAKKDDDDEEEEKPRRSRRAKKDDDDDDGKITDEHLNKVASRAAAVLTPKRVTAVMDEYGVTDLSKMKQSVRAEFIEQLEIEVAEEEDDD